MKQVLHLASRRIFAIDQVFVLPTNEDLSSHCDFLALLIAHRTTRFIFVVEYNSNDGFVDPCLALLVDEFREVSSSDLFEIGNAEDEANRVKNIGLPRTIQSSDGVEMGIKAAKNNKR
jgi:hypothetical protein